MTDCAVCVQGTPYHLFDYGMGEMSARDATPEQLEAIFDSMVPSGTSSREC